MARKVIKVGVAGYGRSGFGIHTRWFREDQKHFKIVAVADQLADRRAEAEKEWGVPTYKDYKDLLANTEMDLFVNSLPSNLHTEGTLAAFDAGNNVVCEKPVGLSVKQFDSMFKASKKAGKHFLPFQNSRYFAFFKKMRQIIDSGVLGDIVHIRSVWSGFARRWDWQTLKDIGGGNLRNTGPHPLDQAIMLFGEKQPKVFCRMKAIQPICGDAEDFCTMTLYGDEKDPVIELLISSYLKYPCGEMYNVCGTLGGLTGNPQKLTWEYYDPKTAPKQKLWKPWSDKRGYCSEKLKFVKKSWKPGPQHKDSFQANCKGFYTNVYNVLVKGEEQIVKPEEVRRQIKVIDEAHKQNPQIGAFFK